MWLINDIPFTEEMIQDHTGFVYLITNLTNDKKYVGQKNLWVSKVRSIKGKKKKVKVPSDYQTYYGSNEQLNEEVKRLGPDNFTREILYLCKNKGTQNYLELREQMDRRVLEKEEYYNSFVGGKIHKKHVKL